MAKTPTEWLEKAVSDRHINYLEYNKFTNPIEIGSGGFGKVFKDLHSKNILIHQRQPMIADFGLSKQTNEMSMTSNSTVYGMPAYVDPNALSIPNTNVIKINNYIPNPDDQLDVELAKIINHCHKRIKVSMIESGKYMFGEIEPKIFNCRMLRSRMIMVRVGGGWKELSKFIVEHVA
ncbi:hypothetical protein F8M41_012166 [Gigaspora margarita]|uniref:Uncharacterized protein n=1 Tax=Gigaspora margarita TaxID=4874 RepID=A0A8H3WY96_GIGMA|nr:hypothetical protein F8M41_012166 [Gigaspora margarita]